MVAALAAAPFFTKQILWTPISAINMTDIVSNQFKMSGASFVGNDEHGNPFKIRAETGYQTYEAPDIIYLTSVSGNRVRTDDNGTRITEDIRADSGEYNRAAKKIELYGNVRVNSSDGNNAMAKKMVIKL